MLDFKTWPRRFGLFDDPACCHAQSILGASGDTASRSRHHGLRQAQSVRSLGKQFGRAFRGALPMLNFGICHGLPYRFSSK